MKSIAQESFAAGTGTYIVTFEKGLKVKPSDVAKVVAPFKLTGSGASVVRKVEKKDGTWRAGDFVLANRLKKGDEGFKDLLAEVASLAGSGKDTLKVTGELDESEKGKLTLKLTAVAAVTAEGK